MAGCKFMERRPAISNQQDWKSEWIGQIWQQPSPKRECDYFVGFITRKGMRKELRWHKCIRKQSKGYTSTKGKRIVGRRAEGRGFACGFLKGFI